MSLLTKPDISNLAPTSLHSRQNVLAPLLQATSGRSSPGMEPQLPGSPPALDNLSLNPAHPPSCAQPYHLPSLLPRALPYSIPPTWGAPDLC